MPPVYGGLTFRSTGLQTETLFFDLMVSLYEPAEHRGGDDIVPGRAGRFRRNRVPDNRLLPFQGWTRGVGGTVAERQGSWHTAESVLGALLDPSTDPGALVIVSPYMGLASGSASILAAVVEWTPGPVQNTMSYRRWTFVLEAIGEPPNWTVTP
jgi:hypothetical protein